MKSRPLFVGELDQALKELVVSDAAARGSSINDLVVGILAARFGVPFAGTGRRGPGGRGSTAGSFRMPERLWAKIHDAAKSEGSKAAVVRRALADHYGIPYVPAAKPGRRPATVS